MCGSCGAENRAEAQRCRRCAQPIRMDARLGSRGVPVWLATAGMFATGAAGLWLGRNMNGRGQPPAPVVATAVPSPSTLQAPAIAVSRTQPPVAGQPAEAGETWAVYLSKDRLTDEPLFGAWFGTRSGSPLFTVLCAPNASALAVRRGMLPANEGASGDARGLLATIDVGRRIWNRERRTIELRFDDAPPEAIEAFPRDPIQFLNRVASSKRIRSSTEEFEPAGWSDAIEKVRNRCAFVPAVPSPTAAPRRRRR
jgi:hypothetical protein